MDSTLQLDASGVKLPQTISPLTSARESELKARVDPLQESSNCAMTKFVSSSQCCVKINKLLFLLRACVPTFDMHIVIIH